MGFQSSKSGSSNHEFNEECIVSDWLKATRNFHMNYKKIAHFVNNQRNNTNPHEIETLYIGHCSKASLMELMMTMQGELEKLLLTMEERDNMQQSPPEQLIKQLFDHTLILNELNHQAQIRLDLVTHSSY